jgi:hypothetical protein
VARPPLLRDELRRARHFVSNARKIGYENMDKSVKDGGNQIEYEDEDPRVLELYELERSRNGVTSQMGQLVARPVGAPS